MASKILLITDTGPTYSLAAGTVLKYFLKTVPLSIEVDIVIIGDPGLRYPLNSLGRGKVYYCQKPTGSWMGNNCEFIANLGMQYVEKVEVPIVANWLQRLIDQNPPDLILFAFQCPSLASVLNRVRTNSAKRVAFFWDHPSWWASAHGFKGRNEARFLSNYFSVMNSCDVILGPSSGVSKLNEITDSTKVQVWYPSIGKPQTFIESLKVQPTSDTIRIVFAGSLSYARDEIISFLNYLNLISWKVANHQIEFHIFPREKKDVEISCYSGVKYHTFLHPDDLTSNLSNFDFAFLPYPFRESFKNIVNSSFPSKLVTYATASLPVLYFGPPNAAVAEFLKINGGAIMIPNDLSDFKIDDAIARHQQLSLEIRDIYLRYFSEQIFKNNVTKLLSRLVVHDFETPHKEDTEISESRDPMETPEISIQRVRTFRDISVLLPHSQTKKFWEEVDQGPVIFYNWISLSKYVRAVISLRLATRELLRKIGSKTSSIFYLILRNITFKLHALIK